MAASNSVKILIETLYKGKGTKDAAKDLKTLEGQGKKSSISIEDLGKAAAATTGILAGFGIVAKQAFDLGYEGAQISRLEDSFESLTHTAGTSSTQLIEALDKAAQGTISNSNLMLSANRAMMLGLGSDAEQLSQLMEIAAFRGRAMGLTTTQAFSDIVTGIGRGSPLILDNLGIITKGWAEEAKAAGVAYDAQFLLNKVLEDGGKMLSEAGGLAEDTASQYEQLKKEGADLANTLKQGVGEGLSGVVDNLAFLLEKLNDSAGSWEDWGLTAANALLGPVAAGKDLEDIVDGLTGGAIGALIDAWQEVDSAAGKGAEATIDFGNANKEVVESAEDAEEALKRQSDAYKTLLSNMFKIQDANEKFIDDEERRAEKQKELEEEKVRAAIEGTDKQKDLKRDLAELDRDIENARSKKAKGDDAKEAKEERIHDLMVRRQELIERIADAQQEAMVTQVEIDEKLAALEEEKTDAIEDQEKSRKQMVYDTLDMLAAQDGYTIDELKFLKEQQLALGLIDKSSQDIATAAYDAAQMLWEQFEKPGEAVGDIQAALNRVVQGSPYRAQIQIEQVVTSSGIGYENQNDMRRGRSFKLSEDYKNTVGYENLNDRRRGRSYAEGGSFIIPERFGYEGFSLGGIATASGGERVTVTPQGKSNGNVNINITGVVDRRMVKYLKQEITRLQAD